MNDKANNILKLPVLTHFNRPHMKTFTNLKRVVFLGDTSAYFRSLSRNKLDLFLYNGAWFVSADIDQIEKMRLISTEKIEITRKNLGPIYFKFKVFCDYLLISPI